MSRNSIPQWRTPPGRDPYEPWVDINTRKSRQTSRAEWIAMALFVFVLIGAAVYGSYVGHVPGRFVGASILAMLVFVFASRAIRRLRKKRRPLAVRT